MAPDPLRLAAQQGTLLLISGPDAPAAQTGLPPTAVLAAALAAQSGLPARGSLAALAEGLPAHWVAGFLEMALGGSRPPGALHRAIAALPVARFLSLALDEGLAEALAAAGRPANRLLSDVALAAQQLSRPDLAMLCGAATGRTRLVVRESDFQDQPDRARRQLHQRVSAWLAEAPALLVGCDPAAGSDWSQWHYGTLLAALGGLPQGGWLLWPQPHPADVARWAAENITVLDAEPLALLAELAGPARPSVPSDLRAVAAMLRGQPSAQQLAALPQALPTRERLALVRVTLRLSLDANDALLSEFEVRYEPDIQNEFREPPHATGIPLARLHRWALEAEKVQRGIVPTLPGSPAETEAIALFEALIPPGTAARRAYEQALWLRQSFAEKLQWVIEPDSAGRLAALPWEMLHDGRVAWADGGVQGSGFLARSYALYRRVPTLTTPAQVAGRIQRALLLAADPTATLGHLDEEVARLETTLTAAGLSVTTVRPDDPRLDDPEQIKALLRDGAFQLFHFAGHGRVVRGDPAQSFLLLGRPSAEPLESAPRLTAAGLGDVARSGTLLALFLSGCEVGQSAALDDARPWEEGGVVAALARAGLPLTVGMRWRIADDEALQLATRFYEEWLGGQPSEEALRRARQALGAGLGWLNPILTKRHGTL